MSPVLVIAAALAALLILVYLGLRIEPRPFAPPELKASAVETVPLPAGLPAPVERYYRTLYGEQVPVIESAVITGRGRMRPFGIWLAARFIAVHQAGRDYRHYFEATFFGLPFLKVNEGILEGESYFESPMGTYRDDSNTNQGANLALWAEAGWFPAIWVTDPLVQWQAVDDSTALLSVPYEDQRETFVARFDPQTGRLLMLKAMRYRHPKTDQIPGSRAYLAPTASPTPLADQGRPWLALRLEKIVLNADVEQYIRQRGK
jgi:hypothetical protein